MAHPPASAAKAVLLALSVLLSLLPAAQAQTASFTGLGDLPGGDFDSQAYSVSADGSVVVGKGKTVNGDAAFRWTEAGGMVGLGDLPGGTVVSKATVTSADGSVVVGESQSAKGLEAFRWTEAEGMVGLGGLPGGSFFFSRALSTSADGSVIVGESQSPGGFQAFRWEDGTMTGLGDLPGGFFFSQAYTISADGNVIAGQSQSANGPEAFRWTADGGMVGLGDLPGGTYFSVVYSASADGDVLAGWGQSPEGIEAFRWEDGAMTGLGDLPGSFFFSVALATSSDGSAVVGYSEAEPQGYHAFLWTEADGMRDLKEVLENDYGLDLTGWRLSLAYDISDDGTAIVGYGTEPCGPDRSLAGGRAPVGDRGYRGRPRDRRPRAYQLPQPGPCLDAAVILAPGTGRPHHRGLRRARAARGDGAPRRGSRRGHRRPLDGGLAGGAVRGVPAGGRVQRPAHLYGNRLEGARRTISTANFSTCAGSRTTESMHISRVRAWYNG